MNSATCPALGAGPNCLSAGRLEVYLCRSLPAAIGGPRNARDRRGAEGFRHGFFVANISQNRIRRSLYLYSQGTEQDGMNYHVRDIGLASWGRKEIAIAETEMPG